MSRANAGSLMILTGLILLGPRHSWAQGQPAAGNKPPDDTPSIRMGVTLFTDYTYNRSPEQRDADGNLVHFSQFNVSRAYINVTGNLSHVVAFRITPDVSRESGSGSSLAGSLEFRIKYAFAQFNLDDWTTPGSWVRLGIQQTPWLDFAEGIYRYRFQGTMFSEREGYQASADGGASFHYNFPSNYGDVHFGVYNGETYARAEVNNQKALQLRASVRPLPAAGPLLRGLRAHVFYDADSYLANADRKRFIANATVEHRYLNVGFEYLETRDQISAISPSVTGRGVSVWGTPRFHGWEALLRYDRLKPNTDISAMLRQRTIAGVSYWFTLQGNVTTAILLDYDDATFENHTPARPRDSRIAVHGLVNF